MSTAPLPILKGVYRDANSGSEFYTSLQRHNPEAGEAPSDDCMITVPVVLEGGEKQCGESGIWPLADFAKRFQFVRFMKTK
jgi:hypothetical protein